jgi:MoaA/NifB/PqqE/SkfB family radical SAM enzyme
MGDAALPYVLPKVDDRRLETIKFANLLSALRARRQKRTQVSHHPIDATIDLTTACQLKCPYCAVGNGTIARGVTIMKPTRYRQLLSDIGDEAFIIWYFSTGEPLLHKEFGSLLSTSKHQRIFSAISTNLSLPLSIDRVDPMSDAGRTDISIRAEIAWHPQDCSRLGSEGYGCRS